MSTSDVDTAHDPANARDTGFRRRSANRSGAFAPKRVRRRKGRIIVLSSMQGRHGPKHASSYARVEVGHSRPGEISRDSDAAAMVTGAEHEVTGGDSAKAA
jgi:hypothetical protein